MNMKGENQDPKLPSRSTIKVDLLGQINMEKDPSEEVSDTKEIIIAQPLPKEPQRKQHGGQLLRQEHAEGKAGANRHQIDQQAHITNMVDPSREEVDLAAVVQGAHKEVEEEVGDEEEEGVLGGGEVGGEEGGPAWGEEEEEQVVEA